MRVEHQFQALLAGAPDALIIADVAGHILIANSQAEQLFGYAASELIGQPVELLLPQALHARHAQHRAGYNADPHTRPMGSELALVAQRKDGSSFPVEISLSAIQTADGLLITSAIRDVTERKQAADELERQVQQRTAHLNSLLDVSQALFSARSLDAVLQRALTHALALLPAAQRGAIYLYDAAGQRLALRASAGFQPLPSLSLPRDAALVGAAFTARQARYAASPRELAALLAAHAPDAQAQFLRMFELTELAGGCLALPLVVQS